MKGESRSRVKSNDDCWFDSCLSIWPRPLPIFDWIKSFSLLFLFLDIVMGLDKITNNKGVVWTKN